MTYPIDKIASVLDVMHYFDMKPGEFKLDWMKMTVTDKDQLRAGIGNGSLTY